jgi:hypothetical protein
MMITVATITHLTGACSKLNASDNMSGSDCAYTSFILLCCAAAYQSANQVMHLVWKNAIITIGSLFSSLMFYTN